MTWLLVHGNTRCSYSVLRLVHGNDIVLYTYEIQRIHVIFYWVSTYIYAVYSQSMLIDRWQLYRIDTLPDAYFACYRFAHDDGKCTNCMLWLLHRSDIDCFRFEFRFFSFLAEFFASLSFHPCPHISCIYGHHNWQYFTNCSSFLVLNSDPHACHG